jgi:hypothetical protein
MPATGHEKGTSMNHRLATTALLVSAVLTITACGGNPNDGSTNGQPGHAARPDPASAWRVYYDVTHPDVGRAGSAARPDPASAWRVYYDVTHPDLERAGSAARPDPASAWQVYYDLTHPRQAAGSPSGATGEAAGFRADRLPTGVNAVIAWNASAGEAAVASCLSPTNDPLHESRLYAMAHIAIHDALNAIDRRFQPYVFDTRTRPDVSTDAAVAAAAHGVLVPTINDLPGELISPQCVRAGVASVEADYQDALATIPDGEAKTRGIAIGEAAAAPIVAQRDNDGANHPPLVDTRPRGGAPGEYEFTPGTPFAFAPKWGAVTTFTLDDSTQFASGPPYSLTSKRYARDFDEVKRLGGGGPGDPTRSARTAEQTEIALFWVESSPLAWNRLARSLADDRGLDLWQSARLFGLLNTAMTDGYIGTFQEKYDYNFWRPVTAIHRAAEDRNPRTVPDPTWAPLVTTPPIPDHDSGHSVEGGVAATVMQRVFGTDKLTFEVCSLTLPAGQTCDDPSPVTRTFNRLSDAARENGESRVLVGFHFRHAVVDGIAHGRKIGNWAVHHFMQPTHG